MKKSTETLWLLLIFGGLLTVLILSSVTFVNNAPDCVDVNPQYLYVDESETFVLF